MQQQYKESPNHTFFIAFHLTERAGQTTALENKIGFFQEVLLKNLLLYVYCLGFDWSGWIVLIKSEIIIDWNGLAGQFWQMESALRFSGVWSKLVNQLSKVRRW